MGKLTNGVLFVRLCKKTGYCLSACENLWGTICPFVQIDGVLFVRMCKNDGVLFVRGTICPVPWPLNCPKSELAASVLQVKYPAPKNVIITIEFTTNTMGVFCVSLALLFFGNIYYK